MLIQRARSASRRLAIVDAAVVDFRGAGTIARYGGLVAIGQFFGFIQSQADILVAGRLFDAHLVGVYTTALFLTQIFNKIIPPLNEVAFTAYLRLRDEAEGLARPFARAVRAIMAAAMPFFWVCGCRRTACPVLLGGTGWRHSADLAPRDRHALLDPLHPSALQPTRWADLEIALVQRRDRRAWSCRSPFCGGLLGNRRDRGSSIAAYPALFAFAAWRSLPGDRAARGRPARRHPASVLVAMAMAVIVMVAGHLLALVSMAPRAARGNRRADLCGRAAFSRARRLAT